MLHTVKIYWNWIKLMAIFIVFFYVFTLTCLWFSFHLFMIFISWFLILAYLWLIFNVCTLLYKTVLQLKTHNKSINTKLKHTEMSRLWLQLIKISLYMQVYNHSWCSVTVVLSIDCSPLYLEKFTRKGRYSALKGISSL